MQTPWNQSDHQKKLAEGIYWVSTPRHGGIKIEQSASNFLTEASKKVGIQAYNAYWYEEDCDYSVAALEYFNFYGLSLFLNPNFKPILKQELENNARFWNPAYFYTLYPLEDNPLKIYHFHKIHNPADNFPIMVNISHNQYDIACSTCQEILTTYCD